MIDFYTWKTPNGQKIAIMIAECELGYNLHPVDITKQEQFSQAFLEINPNNKIPVIIDQDGPNNLPITISESGAILIYLAEKTGRFLPSEKHKQVEAIQWLMFQMASVGPMLGQVHHFVHYAAERVPYAIERYLNEARRIYRVMDLHLEKKVYFAGEYSIADIAIFPWVNLHERQRIHLDDYPNVKRWHHAIHQRPAVKAGLAMV